MRCFFQSMLSVALKVLGVSVLSVLLVSLDSFNPPAAQLDQCSAFLLCFFPGFVSTSFIVWFAWFVMLCAFML